MPKPVSVGSGTEVVANPEHDRGLHRRFSAEDKQRLLAEAEACTERGALAALLRRERLYSSQLAAWRVQLEREGEAGLAPRKPGRKALKDAKDRRASRRWSATRRSSRASSSSPRSSLSSKKKPRSCWRPPRASTCHECASLEACDPVVPLKSACAALGLARATLYRHRPRVTRPASGPRCSPRRLSEAQRREVLEVLHEERSSTSPRLRSTPSFWTRGGICVLFAPCIGCWPNPQSRASGAPCAPKLTIPCRAWRQAPPTKSGPGTSPSSPP